MAKQQLSRHNTYEIYNSLLDSLPDHILILRHDGEIEWVNKAWRDFAVQNDADPQTTKGIGCNYLAVCEKAELDGDNLAGQALQGIKRVLQRELDSFTLEYPCHSSTEERWFRMGVVRLSSDEQKVLITHHNISERAKVELQLGEEIKRFFTLFDNSPVGFGIVDTDGNFIVYNDALCQVIAPESEDGESLNNLFSLLGTSKQYIHIRDRLQLEEVITREHMHLAGRGNDARDILLSLVPINYDAKSCMLVILEDITEQVQREKALYASEERFRLLVDSMADIIFTIDTEERHTGMYGRWVEDLNLNEEIFLGRTAIEILGTESGLPHHEANQKALTGEDVIYEWSYQAADGEHTIQTRLSPLRDTNAQIIGIVGVGRDITAQKLAEKNIVEHARQLEALYQIAETINTYHEPQEIFEYLIARLAGFLQVEKVAIGVLDPATGIITIKSPAYGLAEALLGKIQYSIAEANEIWDFRSQGALVANAFDQIPEQVQTLAQQHGVTNLLVSEFRSEGHFGGYLAVMNKAGGFEMGDVHFLNIIARQVGITLSRIEFYNRQKAQLEELKVLHQVALAGVASKSKMS